jgi:cysteine desulfurase
MSIYLDHQATSPMPPEVLEDYTDALAIVGNPSSIHRAGQAARSMLENARERIAAVIDCEPIEVVFTSGGTEAINTALKGAVWAARASQGGLRPVIVSTAAEHHATLDAVTWLQHNADTEIHFVPVDALGVCDTVEYSKALEAGPVTLVTTLLANNEVGSLQPVTLMSALARDHNVAVHVDAIAALGYVPVSFHALGVQAMSLSAHKVGGPVGVGALILSRHYQAMEALHHGGDQQRSRSGTLDAAGAVAFATALELRENSRAHRFTELESLRNRLREGLSAAVPEIITRGSWDSRLPGNLHITVPGCEGDVLLYLLDERGIHVSTGSACQAGVPEPSHVLVAMGVDPSEARGALRFSLSYSHTAADIERVISVFPEVVDHARRAGLAAG